jgi:hypothetical protein
VDNIFDVRRFDAVGDDADAAPRAREEERKRGARGAGRRTTHVRGEAVFVLLARRPLDGRGAGPLLDRGGLRARRDGRARRATAARGNARAHGRGGADEGARGRHRYDDEAGDSTDTREGVGRCDEGRLDGARTGVDDEHDDEQARGEPLIDLEETPKK